MVQARGIGRDGGGVNSCSSSENGEERMDSRSIVDLD